MDRRLERNILFGSKSKNNIIETKILNENEIRLCTKYAMQAHFQSFTSECVVFLICFFFYFFFSVRIRMNHR